MSDSMINVLLVEDDGRLASLTSEYLQRRGLLVTTVKDGTRGLSEALHYDFDIMLLDIMLPGMDGMEILRKVREKKDTPVIMLTARGEEADKVIGLEMGADDYLPKPFSPRELLARINSAVRRHRGQMGPGRSLLKIGDLTIDTGSNQAVMNGETLELTSYEFAILTALAKNAGRVLSRDRLMDLAKGNSEESFDRSVDVHVSRLRKKLGDDPRRPKRIRTVRGVGYLYMAGDKA